MKHQKPITTKAELYEQIARHKRNFTALHDMHQQALIRLTDQSRLIAVLSENSELKNKIINQQSAVIKRLKEKLNK